MVALSKHFFVCSSPTFMEEKKRFYALENHNYNIKSWNYKILSHDYEEKV